MYRIRFFVIVGMILAAAASRLIPHPPNLAPIGAMALFGGACFAQKRWAFVVPLAALFLSDLVLGLYSLMPVVYGAVLFGGLALAEMGLPALREPAVALSR